MLLRENKGIRVGFSKQRGLVNASWFLCALALLILPRGAPALAIGTTEQSSEMVTSVRSGKQIYVVGEAVDIYWDVGVCRSQWAQCEGALLFQGPRTLRVDLSPLNATGAYRLEPVLGSDVGMWTVTLSGRVVNVMCMIY